MTNEERRLVFGYTTVLQAQHLLEHAMNMFDGTEYIHEVNHAMQAAKLASASIFAKVDAATQYEDGGGDDE